MNGLVRIGGDHHLEGLSAISLYHFPIRIEIKRKHVSKRFIMAFYDFSSTPSGSLWYSKTFHPPLVVLLDIFHIRQFYPRSYQAPRPVYLELKSTLQGQRSTEGLIDKFLS